MLKFPDGFLWGTATAAHQVEGANDNNDWSDWEQTPGHVLNGDRTTVACDWWKGERYREDFDLAAAQHQNAHRLSVEWSRIEPREGEWSAEAIAYYRRVLTALRDRGLTPLVTLYHFTKPRWLATKGGWETRAAVPLFERYVTHVVLELGSLCDFWVTVNEPASSTFEAYAGEHTQPPGKDDVLLAVRVIGNLIRGHAAAYHAIHRIQPGARVGVAHHFRGFVPANPRSPFDRWASNLRDRTVNQLFLLALRDGSLHFPLSIGDKVPEAANTQDYIGVNYYFTERTAFDRRNPGQLFTRSLPSKLPPEAPRMAGDVIPSRFRYFLKEQAGWGKPIYVTENGIFDLGGELQTRYLVSHLVEVHKAIREGAPVKGYFYWTLVDNFEWAEGYSARFGLFQLDIQTQKRTPRPSAGVYARIVQENGIADDLIDKYGNTD